MRFQTKEEFQAWYQKNRDKIEKFHREADVNSSLYHEVAYANGKETYYLYGNPSEKRQNPRRAVWNIIGKTNDREKIWHYIHEAFEEDKVYLVTRDTYTNASRRIKDGRYSNPDGLRSPIQIIYIPPQEFYDEGGRRVYQNNQSRVIFPATDDTYKIFWEIGMKNTQYLSSWATGFLEYPTEVIGPSLNYPRGEFHR